MNTRQFFACLIVAIFVCVPTMAWAQPFNPFEFDVPQPPAPTLLLPGGGGLSTLAKCMDSCAGADRQQCEEVCELEKKWRDDVGECFMSCSLEFHTLSECHDECHSGYFRCCEALGTVVPLSDWDTWCDEPANESGIMPPGDSVHFMSAVARTDESTCKTDADCKDPCGEEFVAQCYKNTCLCSSSKLPTEESTEEGSGTDDAKARKEYTLLRTVVIGTFVAVILVGLYHFVRLIMELAKKNQK